MSNFGDLTNIEDFEKRDNFNQNRGDVSFYCKDCHKIVKTKRPKPNGYTFICEECKGKRIALGTEEGLKEKYKIK